MPNLNLDEIPFPEFVEAGTIARRLATDEWLRVFLYSQENPPDTQVLELNERIQVLQQRLAGLTINDHMDTA